MTPTQKSAMQAALGCLVRAEAMYRQPNAAIQEALRAALLELSPSDVRITKAADQPGVWYVIPTRLGAIFKMPHGDGVSFQLRFHVSSVDEVFSELLAGGYTIVDDPMFRTDEPKFTGEISDSLRCWKATRINGASASMASDGDANVSLIKAFDQIAAWVKDGGVK